MRQCVKESEGKKGRKEPGTEEPTSSEPKGGACGTCADEVGDGNSKSTVKRDQRGRIRTKHWRDKKEGLKGPFRCKEGAGEDTTAHQGGARKKTGSGKQFSSPIGATDQTLNNQQKKSQSGRERGTSKEHQAESSHRKGKRSDRNQAQQQWRPQSMKSDPCLVPNPTTQSHLRGMFPGKCFSLDLKALKKMDSIEVVNALNQNMPGLKFFLRSTDEEHSSDEFIMDLTCTLANACKAPPGEDTNRILTALRGSVFLTSKIPRLLDRLALNDQDVHGRLFHWLITVFMNYLRHLPSSYAYLPYDQLKRTLDQSNSVGKEELQRKLQAFKQARDDIVRANRQKHGKHYINNGGQKPPNNFRNLPVCPTTKEIRTQERPFLRKNITKGRYEDAEHYLDVQFRLLREDFLEPLREGIHEIIQNVPRKMRNQLMRYYPGARIVGKTCTPSGISYKVQFDISRFNTRRWAHSKRLIFGSFLCLSKDNFETMLFATVCNRIPEELITGKIDIRFLEEQDTFGIENRNFDYQMVESPAYYEAYCHVLKGLKELDETTLPFKKYLVECSEEVDPPEYLRREDTQEPVCYDLTQALNVPDATEAKRVPILQLDAWPPVETLPLNESQLEALKMALSTEFSVIQGPPGTGKTYVGAKIVRCLLENREAWDPNEVSPMLMVCYTNHALDQFLVKALEFLPKEEIIRVGGRCKSKQLEECNLKLFTSQYRRNDRRGEVRALMADNVSAMKHCKELLAEADGRLLALDDLEDLLCPEHVEQLYNAIFPHNAARESRHSGNTFTLWLCSNELINSCNRRTKSTEEGSQNELVFPKNEAGEDEGIFHDSTLLMAPFIADEVGYDAEMEGASGQRKVSFAVTPTSNDIESSRPPAEEQPSKLPKHHPKPMKNLLSDQRDLQATSLASATREAPESFVSRDTSLTASIALEASPQTHFITEKDNDTETVDEVSAIFEETITVEKEADLIQYQRCLHGDGDFLPVTSKTETGDERSPELEGKHEEEGWEIVVYKKKKKGKVRFHMKQKISESSEGALQEEQVFYVPDEGNTDPKTSSKKKKKKQKKKIKKIHLTANIDDLRRKLEKETTMTYEEAMSVKDIWLLSPSERLRLYLFWVESYRERYRVEIHKCEREYEQLCHELDVVRFQEEEEVIRRATVIGMTTSGAARYHSVLQRVAPKIVIIEEAAEVMEAHIITSLSHSTKHTILIGDHKQLRPKATVYELAQKYNLEISLFERMVMNCMECKRLSIQHRMRPEIAALTKRIYEHEIIDHESVCSFENITGVSCNLFFIDHRQPENLEGGLQSYSNPHEADFLVALCNYLLLQGYKQNQITILTMYTGQLLLLQEKMPRRIFGGIRVCAVDNFQGEESDIVLLSLVRSNSEHKIGFLRESNRICVALSRAREGFYCIGNFHLLKSQCKLWREICDYLQTQNSIGENLQLVCKRHSNVFNVQSGSDFNILGGCKKICGDRLNCGHACESLCHVHDPRHQNFKCLKSCSESCSNGHQCRLVCHSPVECPKCVALVTKIIPGCGHEQQVPCATDPSKCSCRAQCEKLLRCGHKCTNSCGAIPCTKKCLVQCKKILPCGHERLMACFENPMEHRKCNASCPKVLDCGHPCSMRCTDTCRCNSSIKVELECGHQKIILCRDKEHPQLCSERCERELDCGHICQAECHEDCGTKRCESAVSKCLPCGHQQIVPCYMNPKEVSCNAPCERQLKCGHKCSSVCGRQCQEVQCQHLCETICKGGHACQKPCHFNKPCGDCMEMVNVTIPSCKHSIEIYCYVELATVTCNRPCERVRACGHPCHEICGKGCETRPCKEIVTRTLLCGHAVPLPCRKDPERYKCKEKIEVYLSCGHSKVLECYVAKAGKEKILCNEIVPKELRCKHVVSLPCHKGLEEYNCKQKVKVELSCGHAKTVFCFVATGSLQSVNCKEKVERKLPCGHNETLPCYINPEDYCCQKEVEITLPCLHKKLIACAKVSRGLRDEPCDEIMTRKLPCNHEKQMKCSSQTEKAFCDAPCERLLPCNHPCPGKCGDKCVTFKCAVKVEKVLACGKHWKSCRCSEDVSQSTCSNSCTLTLSCGHRCPGKCFEDCNNYKCSVMMWKQLGCVGNHWKKMACSEDSRTAKCEKQCNRTLVCGHPCPGLCSQDCGGMKCIRRVEKRFPCGHEEPLQCYQSEGATCIKPCLRRKSRCKHMCKGVCGDDCSKYPCDVVVNKTLACGHKIRMLCSRTADAIECPVPCGKKLLCGHQCSGACKDCQPRGSHELCQYTCGKLLVCLHRCKALCSEPCPPCDRNCSRGCPHGKWSEKCSKPYEPCKKPCTWSCPHYQCNNLCGEECDRPRCNAPCTKKLPCRHPCIGLCGENCPTLCGICPSKKLSSLFGDRRGEKMEVPRCLQLFDCGHIVKVDEMDAWVLLELGNDVHLLRCPKCTTSITFSYRYANIIKRVLTNIEDVKRQLQQVENEVTNSAIQLGKDLIIERPKHDRKKKKRVQQTKLDCVQAVPWTWNPFNLPDANQNSVLKSTFRNHLIIFQQVKRAEQLLKGFKVGCEVQHKVGNLSKATLEDALEDIKEYLEDPQLDLKSLSQVYEQARKFFLFSSVLEVYNTIVRKKIALSSIGETRLKLACDGFSGFIQGDDGALDLERLEKIVNALRAEVKLAPLPPEEAKVFSNFPGYQSDIWKLCGQGHVYYMTWIVRGGEDIPIGSKGCTRCTRSETG
ncbi:NFX1-type zinc finger-containing protein 1-like [Stylophora pistillata]|uniref:NFX1-type zinc finger-containing protein 1-like n=1 Tax=Stylophora pistillata TaxID=50429 RepID=UPI000C051CD7|nr:NFX1-type zinc finger-containing protein 1-like [Stylophora pistillata]